MYIYIYIYIYIYTCICIYIYTGRRTGSACWKQRGNDEGAVVQQGC